MAWFHGLTDNIRYISFHYTGRKIVEVANYAGQKMPRSFATTGRVRYVDVKDNILYYTQQGPSR